MSCPLLQNKQHYCIASSVCICWHQSRWSGPIPLGSCFPSLRTGPRSRTACPDLPWVAWSPLGSSIQSLRMDTLVNPLVTYCSFNLSLCKILVEVSPCLYTFMHPSLIDNKLILLLQDSAGSLSVVSSQIQLHLEIWISNYEHLADILMTESLYKHGCFIFSPSYCNNIVIVGCGLS